MASSLRFQRILLKLSGEALAGDRSFGIDPGTVNSISKEIREIVGLGCEVALVIGGGNIFRGMAASEQGMDRASADYMGMLATAMNSLALQDSLEKLGLETRVLSAITMIEVAEPYIRRRAIRHLEKGRVVIFAAGTGNPYFTTDTAAALRAMEIKAQAILKATKVDGVYDKDPMVPPAATMFKRVTHHEALSRQLKVMDSTALAMAMDNKLPIIVFNLFKKGNIKQVVTGSDIGTTVQGGE